MRPSRQFGQCDRTHRDRFWKGSSNRLVVPVGDNRGIEKSGCHLQALVHDPIEICSESLAINLRPVGGKGQKFS